MSTRTLADVLEAPDEQTTRRLIALLTPARPALPAADGVTGDAA